MIFPNFQNRTCCEEYLKDNKNNIFVRKTVRFSKQKMSADKYHSIFPRQIGAIVYLLDKVLELRSTREIGTIIIFS